MSEMTWHSCIPYLQLFHCYQVVQYCQAVPVYRKRSHVLRCGVVTKHTSVSGCNAVAADASVMQISLYTCAGCKYPCTHAPDANISVRMRRMQISLYASAGCKYPCTHAPDGIKLARPFACGIVCALICINTLSFVLLVSLYTCYCISFGHCYIGVVTVDHGSGDH